MTTAAKSHAAAHYEALLLKSASEALEIARGQRTPAHQRERTARDTTVTPPPAYTASRVRRVRQRLKISQPVFAGMLNVSASTVRAWEQGARHPDGPSLRLLQIAEQDPIIVMRHAQTVADANRRTAGALSA